MDRNILHGCYDVTPQFLLIHLYFGASSLGAQILPVTLNCLLSLATANVYGYHNVFTNLYATPNIALGNLIV